MSTTYVGTAGWSVDRSLPQFDSEGSSLERYASVFKAVEINSSFYRRHRQATWKRWHDAVPSHFRFSIKLPKLITHEHRLIDVEAELDIFIGDVEPLSEKLGAILVQLPPQLTFDAKSANEFFSALRTRTNTPIFVEPRHVSWAFDSASELLERFSVTRVLADPQKPELRPERIQGKPGYLRLHGSPEIYYSAYPDEMIAQYARLIDGQDGTWCIFDNTASGAAIHDALKLLDLLQNKRTSGASR